MINYEKYKDFVEHDKLSLEYDKVSKNINSCKNTDHALDIIFKYWRKKGFPHYEVHNHKKQRDIQLLKNFDEKTIYKDGKLDQTMHGLSLAWSYFPHWVDVVCGSQKESPIERWNDDKILKTVIKKTWKWQLKHGNGTFTTNRLRQNFKIYGASQTVSNFRPTVAKYIYNAYGNNGVIWDMSCGWGGRLLGFMSSNCKTYIGTEPSSKTFTGLSNMVDDLGNKNQIIQIYQEGSEVFKPEQNTLDLCFTSPPYFDTEKYSEEETQSYIKYPSEKQWLDGFLTDTIRNCEYGLKQDGFMILNIADTPKHKNIESETIRISQENGFILKETLYLILSSVSGKGQKLEPVMVFQKI